MTLGAEIRGTKPKYGSCTQDEDLPPSSVATVTFDPDEIPPKCNLQRSEKAEENKEAGPTEKSTSETPGAVGRGGQSLCQAAQSLG